MRYHEWLKLSIIKFKIIDNISLHFPTPWIKAKGENELDFLIVLSVGLTQN